MTSRFIDWIWHVRGSVPLPAGQSGVAAFDSLEPLFRERGTSRERAGNELSFTKVDPDAQDRMSVFDRGVLRIEQGVAGAVLRYNLVSRALLFCFLAPLMFIGVAQLTVVVMDRQNASADAAKADKARKAIGDKVASVPMNWIDKALGAPEPDKKKADKPEGRRKKPSTTPAYVFAGIFAALYVIGRILEDRLARNLFRRRLLAAAA